MGGVLCDEFLQFLDARSVEYAIVGGFAVACRGSLDIGDLARLEEQRASG